MALLSFASSCTLQRSATEVSLADTRAFHLTSSINSRALTLYVSLPDSYGDEPGRRYPVFYLLDGNLAFPLASSVYDILHEGDAVQDIIIVGIGYPESSGHDISALRFADYSPSRYAAADLITGQPADLPSGQGEAFLQTLAADVIPLVESRFRAGPTRCLGGHSIAGLLSLHALLSAPGLFDCYMVSSPSLWWNEMEVFETEAAFHARSNSLPSRVFLSAGGLENERQLPPFRQLQAQLTASNYADFEGEFTIYPGRTHMSVVPLAIADALAFLFPPEQAETDSN